MEPTSQVGTSASDAPPAAADADLREELAKWRERVPKLASALRQRVEEAQNLKQELERLQRDRETAQDVSSGIRARDDLIAELERKLAALTDSHQATEGELHKRRLEVDALHGDVETWKEKWQSAIHTLDDQAAQAGNQDQRAHDLEAENESLRGRLAETAADHEASQRALDEAVDERDSLRRRNEQLFETTELANRQIGSLTDSLAELRASLKQHREREAEAGSARAQMEDEVQSLRARLAETEETARRQAEALSTADIEAHAAGEQAAALETRLTRAEDAASQAEQALVALTDELCLVDAAAASALHSGASAEARVKESERVREDLERRMAEAEERCRSLQGDLDEQCEEVVRLGEVVERAQRTTGQRENERRELSERLQVLEDRNDYLEKQLAERSELVVNLEQDQASLTERRDALEKERATLEEALHRAERHVKENAEHVTQLDAKVERQKELMLNLEEELAEAQEELSRARKAGTAESADSRSEVAHLREQVRKLEGLVRERTDALNRLEWRREVADSRGEAATQDKDGKLLLVLNQQLADARVCNEELTARVRELEARGSGHVDDPRPHAERRHCDGDDLTRIHGVGPKLAEQLNDLGIHHYRQIAELDEEALADESHVLHGHRGRIVRDSWVEQAVRLVSH